MRIVYSFAPPLVMGLNEYGKYVYLKLNIPAPGRTDKSRQEPDQRNLSNFSM
jgi:hypothetical protein